MADNSIHFGTGSGEGKGGNVGGIIPPVAGSKEQVDASKAKRDAVIASRPPKEEGSGSQKARTGGVEGQVFVEQDSGPSKSKAGRVIKPGAKHGVILAHQQTAQTTLQGHINALMPHRDAHEALGAMLDVANGKLAAAQPHQTRAQEAMRGYKIGDKFFNTQHEAPGHLKKSHALLNDAQEIMSHPFVLHATQHFGVSAGHAGDSIAASAGGLGQARTKRSSNPFKTVNIAGRVMPRGILIHPDNPTQVALAKDAMGMLKGTSLGDKLETAERGTPRGKRATVRPDKRAGSSRREARYQTPAVKNAANISDYQPKSPIGPKRLVGPIEKPGTPREGK